VTYFMDGLFVAQMLSDNQLCKHMSMLTEFGSSDECVLLTM